MTSIDSIESLILDLPPSCIEFSPKSPSHFVVGTYFLEKPENEESDSNDQPQKRSGSLIVYQLSGIEIIQQNVLRTSYAILDLHFSSHPVDSSPSTPLLAVAGSTGIIQVFTFSPTTPHLTLVNSFQLLDPSILVLSLAWHPTNPSLIGFTASDGGVYVLNRNDSSATKIHDHDLEAWTLIFSPNGSALFSGGDDATLRFATLPPAFSLPSSSMTDSDAQAPVQWSSRNIHGAGVTAILPLADEQDIVLTGSYDDHIRVLRTAHPGRKTVLAEENLGGGVWRLKMMSSSLGQETGEVRSEWVILASCMHAGARIVRIKKTWDREQSGAEADAQWEIEVLAKFEEHKSMNYGSDVQPASVESGTTTIVSTSFYDKLLCLWRY